MESGAFVSRIADRLRHGLDVQAPTETRKQRNGRCRFSAGIQPCIELAVHEDDRTTVMNVLHVGRSGSHDDGEYFESWRICGSDRGITRLRAF
jgi:hypothetical protein